MRPCGRVCLSLSARASMCARMCTYARVCTCSCICMHVCVHMHAIAQQLYVNVHSNSSEECFHPKKRKKQQHICRSVHRGGTGGPTRRKLSAMRRASTGPSRWSTRSAIDRMMVRSAEASSSVGPSGHGSAPHPGKLSFPGNCPRISGPSNLPLLERSPTLIPADLSRNDFLSFFIMNEGNFWLEKKTRTFSDFWWQICEQSLFRKSKSPGRKFHLFSLDLDPPGKLRRGGGLRIPAPPPTPHLAQATFAPTTSGRCPAQGPEKLGGKKAAKWMGIAHNTLPSGWGCGGDFTHSPPIHPPGASPRGPTNISTTGPRIGASTYQKERN